MLAEIQRAWPEGISWEYIVYNVVLLILAAGLWNLWLRLRAVQGECRRERRGREEMEAYLRLDVRLDQVSDLNAFSRRVCDVVAERSAFNRVALLVRNAKGGLEVAASEGMEEATCTAVKQWLDRREDQRGNGVRFGAGSTVVSLPREAGEEFCRMVMVPIEGAAAGENRRVGTLVVCANSIFEIPRRSADEAVVSLEALAVKLGRAMEALSAKEPGKNADEKTSPERYLIEKVARERSMELHQMPANGWARQ